MNVLESILRPAAVLMNRQVQASTPARALCAELDGRVFAVRVNDTVLAAYFLIGSTRVSLQASYDDEPDVVISGSLMSLARLATGNDESLIRDGLVELRGNGLLAQQFRQLLAHGRPDLEEELSHVVGDVAAHGAGNIVRGIGNWGREAGSTIAQNIAEYLQEESLVLPGRFEADAFRDRVTTLRDDVARFDARLRQLEDSVTGDRA
jgi:ubiquinone biosynthesis protein UbiJ